MPGPALEGRLCVQLHCCESMARCCSPLPHFFAPNIHHSSCNLQLQICSASDGDVVDASCPHMHCDWEGFSPRKGRSRRGEPAVKGELHGGAGMGVFQMCSKARAGRAVRELTWNPTSLSYACSNTSLLLALPRHVPRRTPVAHPTLQRILVPRCQLTMLDFSRQPQVVSRVPRGSLGPLLLSPWHSSCRLRRACRLSCRASVRISFLGKSPLAAPAMASCPRAAHTLCSDSLAS